MKITKIGYGYTKNEGNYENSKIYLEAEIEGWEDASQSLDILRSQVAEELNLPQQLCDLREQIRCEKMNYKNLRVQIAEEKGKLERAQRAWENFSEFLTAHGVDPETLTIADFSAMRKLHTGYIGQENTIGYSSKDATNESTESGFYYELYEGGDSESHEDYEENPYHDRIPF